MAGSPHSPHDSDRLAGYFEPLCGFFCRQWRFSLEDAQDLTQETSIRAYQRLHQLAASESFEAWLYAIARNLARSHYQRLRRMGATESLEALEAGGAPVAHEADGPEEVAQKKALVAEALRRVREKNQKAGDVLYYREGEGLSYGEIAPLVGETPANCRQLHTRYLRLLRQYGREYIEQRG